MKEQQLIVFYVARPEHTWHFMDVFVPADLNPHVAVSRAEGLLMDYLFDEMHAAGLTNLTDVVTFTGLYRSGRGTQWRDDDAPNCVRRSQHK